MAAQRGSGLGHDERALAVELAAVSLARIAPDELTVLGDTAAEYFDNPDELLRQDVGDSPLGSGITVAMMTPYLLAGAIIKGVAVEVAKEPATSWIRRLFKRSPAEPPGPVALTVDQAAQLRQAV